MSTFIMLHAPQLPKGKSSLLDLSGAWCVDMFFKTASGLHDLVVAPAARDHILKSQHIGSLNREAGLLVISGPSLCDREPVHFSSNVHLLIHERDFVDTVTSLILEWSEVLEFSKNFESESGSALELKKNDLL